MFRLTRRSSDVAADVMLVEPSTDLWRALRCERSLEVVSDSAWRCRTRARFDGALDDVILPLSSW